MKETKAQKGITLIALIITIVVLLILAAVSISSIQGDGILQYATNAATTYNLSVENEQKIRENYILYLNGEISFSIDGTTYYAKEGMTWEQWIASDFNAGKLYETRDAGWHVHVSGSESLIVWEGEIGGTVSYLEQIIEGMDYRVSADSNELPVTPGGDRG